MAPQKKRVQKRPARKKPASGATAASAAVLAGKRRSLEKDATLAVCNLSTTDLERSECKWEDLEWIFTLHERNSDILRATAQFLADSLRQLPEVHSLKFRVKDPYHLIGKVVRKRIDNPKRAITPDNYAIELTDLVGLRALHLFKAEWRPIHEFVTRSWKQFEKPTAYHRQGDPRELIEAFEAAGCNSKEHPSAYRSVHYLLECRPTKELVVAELQVRSVFEEGWSEIDHLVRYPHSMGDEILNQYLTLFNRAAGIADEMGSFLQRLKAELADREKKAASERKTLESKIADLEKEISKLQISEKERKQLEKELAEVKKAQSSSAKATAGAHLGSILFDNSVRIGSTVPDHSVYGSAIAGSVFPSGPKAVSLMGIAGRQCSVCGRHIPHTTAMIGDKCTSCMLTTPLTVSTI
jgi:putative GTP pyrophosphokinase